MAFAEIKDRRKYSMAKLNELGGYMISLHKVERGKSLCKEARVSFFVIVKCSDATYYVNMEEIKNPRVGFFDGNKIPRRVEDKEPVIYIDAYWFSTLRGGACQPP